jgi:heme exporter protein A
VLSVHNLACRRGDRVLFEHLEFTLEPGQLLHLTGRNGSGKTTLLRTLCGLTLPHEGSVHWQGEDIRELGDEFRAELTYVGHPNAIHGELTPEENLFYATGLARRPERARIAEALERVGLAPQRYLASKLLSQGQRRRVALARLLILESPLWLLDEPFNALDRETAEQMGAVVARHVEAQGLVIVTSHTALPVGRESVRELPLEAPE